MNNLIEQLKEAGEDFEFYPTTDEIILKISNDIKYHAYESRYGNRSSSSILDIGAGNGKVLLKLEQLTDLRELYAIEKAEILRNALDNKIGIVGTDFLEQSLIDKQIDITFCNPPYSVFQQWAVKIIRESSSNTVYLVIPERWKDSEEIRKAMKYRDAKVKILGDYTFEHAEDRTARARVQLLKIELAPEKEDAFNRLFNEEFKTLRDKFKDEETDEETDKPTDKENDQKFKTLVTGKDYVHNLVEMYNTELSNIRKNYETVGTLDAALLREFGIFPAKVRQCLKERITGLKNIYWHELISRMDKITERLTSKKRRELLDTAQKSAHVDFTESNIYAVILWILKNASSSIDEQLLEVFEKMLSMANCRAYKSNTRPFEKDQWRYGQEKPSHIALEYRIVLHCCGRIEANYSNGYRLSENGCEMIGDLLTIANGLGFICTTSDGRLYHYNNDTWTPGGKQEFTFRKDKLFGTLLEVRAHLNGNIHLRMNQKFALALNVEYGRLKGWLKNAAEACSELQDKEAASFFKLNTLLPEVQFPLLFHTEEQETCTEPDPAPDPDPEQNECAKMIAECQAIADTITQEEIEEIHKRAYSGIVSNPELYPEPSPAMPDSVTNDFLSLLTV